MPFNKRLKDIPVRLTQAEPRRTCLPTLFRGCAHLEGKMMKSTPITRHASEGWHPVSVAGAEFGAKLDPSLRWGDELRGW